MQALADFDKVIQLDSTNSLTYFNRAMLRTQIGDYNHALEDTTVARSTRPTTCWSGNRAQFTPPAGREIERAVEDYTSAIKPYTPTLANAYIWPRPAARTARDPQGAKETARSPSGKNRRIPFAPERQHLFDLRRHHAASTAYCRSTASSPEAAFDRITGHNGGHEEMCLLPLFKFTLMRPDSVPAAKPYHLQRVDDFKKRIGNEYHPRAARRATSRSTRCDARQAVCAGA